MPRTSSVILGIDVGGTKIELCRFDRLFRLSSSAVLPTATVAVRGRLTPPSLASVIRPYVDQAVTSIGLGIKGVVAGGKLQYSSLFGGLVQKDIGRELRKRFHIPVTVVNDVHAMAIAEQVFGVGRATQRFAFINLGTGIRVACVYDGVYIGGAAGTAGEVSNLKFSRHRWGQVLSGGGLEALYYRSTGRRRSAAEVFRFASRDGSARACVGEFIVELARLFLVVSAFYDPDTIVLAGGLMESARYFLPKAVVRYRRELPHPTQPARILQSRLAHAACLGAAITVAQEFRGRRSRDLVPARLISKP